MGMDPDGGGSSVILALLPAQHTLEHIVSFTRDIAAYSETFCYLTLDSLSPARDSIIKAEVKVDFIAPEQPTSNLTSIGASISQKLAGGCKNLLLDLTSRNPAYTDERLVKFIHFVMAETKASGATIILLTRKDSIPTIVYSELTDFADEVLEL